MDTRTSDLRPPQPLRTGDRAPRVTRLRRATLATIAASDAARRDATKALRDAAHTFARQGLTVR
ncbi:hypothetical protein, partial [Corynebacterium bovis]|uniref:hypothetical protein n=1 Tax=Corynebacterium bovis TaxID=36808 RepID=UPI000FAE7BF4